ncbi:MAG: ABC transporter ATP-binding protein [Parachlamydia sp.]|nr:ABC transporter ATP-binding protein [Parachlamydia sp.]
MKEIVAKAVGISKDYWDGPTLRRVLQHADLEIYSQQLTMIVGPSGSGKTTLLSILGLIIPPSEGKVYIQGQDLSDRSEDEITTFRLRSIGFVFQNFTLVNALNVLENILIPVGIQGSTVTPAHQQKAKQLLWQFDLEQHVHSYPEHLSGGEKQRVAIIRALMNDPPLLLCDEPTSVLDQINSAIVLKTLQELAQESNRAVVMITHDPRAIKYADTIMEIENGVLKTQNEVPPDA